METRKTPESPAQITEFLLCCLYVLQNIYQWKQMQNTLAQTFAYSIQDTGEEKTRERMEIMLSHSVRYDVQIQNLLDAEEGRYVLEHLPLRYCAPDTVLWLLRRHLQKNFSDLPSAFHACDKNLSAMEKTVPESTGKKKAQNGNVRHRKPEGRPTTV